MFTGSNCVALVMGRGGSSFPDKNVFPICGKPLVWYPARAATMSRYITAFYTSSDCEKILSATDELCYRRIVRPDSMSGPQARQLDAIEHAIAHIESEIGKVGILVLLQANCATVKPSDIDKGIKMLLNNPVLDSVIPVIQDQDHHPFRAKKISIGGMLEPYFDFRSQDISSNRQDLPANYFLCHSFYILNLCRSRPLSQGQLPFGIMGYYSAPLIMKESIDVHGRDDLDKTRQWLLDNGLEFDKLV